MHGASIRTLVSATLAVAVLWSAAAQSADLASRCATAAQAWLDTLDGDARELAAQSFDETRYLWSYAPNVPQLTQRLEGLPLIEMDNVQRIAAQRLIQCGLSSQGYAKASGIMLLDDVLAQTDLYRDMEGLPIGSEYYWLAVFGEPGDDAPWGWQLEGHHLVMNFTVVDGRIAYAPVFIGADPAVVLDGRLAGWRNLSAETDKAYRLVQSLSARQLAQAIIDDDIPARLLTGRQGKGDELQEFSGIRFGELSEQQQLLLISLAIEYLGNAHSDILLDRANRLTADAAANQLWFAWAGSTEPGGGVYYRIHSPSVLIEFATARNRQAEGMPPDPNHLHTIFRDPANDFGANWLQHHLDTSPHHNGGVPDE